ncbi:MAG: hypothetical protein PUC12_03490 [Clostridiales bacterium]|nr:hypothetical protein [Clostridiales bacterium]
MFRESYQKDNEMIKPDAEFLERLKETVVKEQEEGGLREGKSEVSDNTSHTAYMYRFAVVAACLLFVIGVVVFRKDIWDSVNYKDGGLKTKAVLKQMNKEENNSLEDEQLTVLKELIGQQVVFYKLQSANQEKEDGCKLPKKEAQDLKNDILSDQYKIVQEEKELKTPVYYAVWSVGDKEIHFAVDGDGHIWIQ